LSNHADAHLAARSLVRLELTLSGTHKCVVQNCSSSGHRTSAPHTSADFTQLAEAGIAVYAQDAHGAHLLGRTS